MHNKNYQIFNLGFYPHFEHIWKMELVTKIFKI
jgi:hypothetical protein